MEGSSSSAPIASGDRASVGAAARQPARWVMDFAEGSRELRDLLGGKGANVA